MLSEEEKKWFIGKKIKDIYVDGSMVELTLEDNTKLEYSASDGGYSSYEIEMGNEIKVGEYVRLDDGTIGKYQIDKNWNNVVETNDKYIGFDIEKDIVKHSSNLIELIECGDYVNGQEVTEIKEWNSSKDGYFRYAVTCHHEIIRADEIETIVSKEMMESISIKLQK